MRTIKYFIDEQARNLPDKTYMIAPEPGLSLSYEQLKEGSIRFGKYVAKMGLKKGDKVSFMLANGFQANKIFLGTMYAGFVVAPLNLQVQPSQLIYVLEHSDTQVVFYSQDHKERLLEAVAKVDREIRLVEIDNNVENIIPELEDLSGVSLPEISEEDDALLLYTSGTTGVPKGVILSNKNMVAGGEYTALAHELTPDDRALCSLPLYHINGEVVTSVTPLVSGGSVLMPNKFSTGSFWEHISEYGCTWFSVVPTMISYLCSATNLEGKGFQLNQVRFGRSASSALPPSLHKTFEEKFGISIVETMGLTETAAPVFSNPIDPKRRKYGSPGPAVGNTAKIINEKGEELPRGEQGEIMIKGDNVMKEYYKAPDITAETIEPDGWLHTGDLGYMDEDGFVFVTGRIKELIIKGGENIAPKEIDEALYQHPEVLDAAAVGIPDDTYGEEILAGVTLQPGSNINEQELLDHCLELLGKFKTPKIIKIMDELPKGPSGKIQRLKLLDLI